ncbi:MAG: hypothetical protein ACYCO3_05400 [Mycobacteriales bacterium]
MSPTELAAPPVEVRVTLPRRLTPTDSPVGFRRALRRIRPTEAGCVFALAASGYLYLATILLAKGVFYGDAVTRVANAYYVLYSRDPHLAAIGFVWNPLPSLMLLPFLWLGHFWQFLVHRAFLGNIESALFMAGAAALLPPTLRQIGVGRLPRLLITAGFAAQPLIAVYGANGMSEASELFTIMLTARFLTSWLVRRRVGDLVGCGVALFFAYLTRYESMGAAALTAALVFSVSFWRAQVGGRRARWIGALTDAGLVAGPFLAAVTLWALASKVIVGHWFATLSSGYGNSNQVASKRAAIAAHTGASFTARAHYLASQVHALEPYLVVLCVLALWTALVRLDLRPLGAFMPFAGVFAFDAGAFLVGKDFGFLRFSIATIPMACIAAGAIAVPLRDRPRRVGGRLRRGSALVGRVAYLAAATGFTAALLGAGLPSTLAAFHNPRLDIAEYQTLLGRLQPGRVNQAARTVAAQYDQEFAVSAQIDAMHLPPRSVITDVANSGGIVLASRNEHQYVITPDRNFARDLADPRRWGIRYFLVPAGRDVASYDAVRAAFPTLGQAGNGYAVPVRVWRGTFTWTLYRITGATPYGLYQGGY